VLKAPFDCPDALTAFLERADVATVEFENIPGELLREIAGQMPLTPGPEAITICQHREREKEFLRRHGFPCVWHAVVADEASLSTALAVLPSEKGILKTAEFGYDGKGQLPVDRTDAAGPVWKRFDSARAVLEERIDLAAELSVIVVRNRLGEVHCYEPAWNAHRHHILDWSLVPCGLPPEVSAQAIEIAREIAESLRLHRRPCGGILFGPRRASVGQRNGAATAQFRTSHPGCVGNLPVRATAARDVQPSRRRDADRVSGGHVEFARGSLDGGRCRAGLDAAARNARAKLHLYGKAEARPWQENGARHVPGPHPG